MYILFIRCAEDASYHQRFAALLADWQRHKTVLAVPNVILLYPNDDKSQLELVLKHLY